MFKEFAINILRLICWLHARSALQLCFVKLSAVKESSDNVRRRDIKETSLAAAIRAWWVAASFKVADSAYYS